MEKTTTRPARLFYNVIVYTQKSKRNRQLEGGDNEADMPKIEANGRPLLLSELPTLAEHKSPGAGSATSSKQSLDQFFSQQRKQNALPTPEGGPPNQGANSETPRRLSRREHDSGRRLVSHRKLSLDIDEPLGERIEVGVPHHHS